MEKWIRQQRKIILEDNQLKQGNEEGVLSYIRNYPLQRKRTLKSYGKWDSHA